MAKFWKRSALFTFLLIGTMLPTQANDATSVVRDLGTLPSADYKQELAQSLFKLIEANPDDRLIAVEARGSNSADDKALTYARYLYDWEKRHFLVLYRTAGADGGDFYHYSSYEDTDPEDFQRRLPVRGQRGYPKVTQSLSTAEVLIPVYAAFPKLSEWP